MAQIRKPNTICKNPNCTQGEDGGRKHYYACMSCLRTENWRAYCCCFDCYEEYTRIILTDRALAKDAKKFPERTDMTENEISTIMEKPIEEVAEYTKSVELADYFEENPTESLSHIVDKVNEDIEHSAKKKKRYKKD